jgi:4-methylaminobutanoate oxidase (formaldehyde-forming)
VTGALPRRTRVAIVGGGILGCAAAWHLARAGVRDVLLLERDELNAATTSQAAGLVGQLRTSAVKSAIVGQTLADITALEAEGLASGFRRTGSLRLALTPARDAEIREQVRAARGFGVDATLVGADDVRRLAPGLEPSKHHAAAWMPNDGYAEPYTLASAYATAARRLGVTLTTGTEVLGIRVAEGRARGVRLCDGDVDAEAVVIAAGAWTGAIAARAGTAVPAFAVRHQAWVTAPMAWIPATFPVVRVPDRLAYLRREVGGLMLGFFETTPLAVEVGARTDFAVRATPRDGEVLTAHAPGLMEVVPGLAEAPVIGATAGVPTYTPDGHFVVGALPGIAGLFVATGCCAHGIAGSGGVGRALAEAVTGQTPTLDPAAMAPGRFGARTWDTAWLRVACLETYAHYYDLVRR